MNLPFDSRLFATFRKSALFAFSFAICAMAERLPDRTTEPIFASDSVELLLQRESPIGHITVSQTGRVFSDAANYIKGSSYKIVEIIGDSWQPFPKIENQKFLDSTHALHTDSQNRLWVLDHGNIGFGIPKLVAFDMTTGALVHRFDFSSDVAGLGSLPDDFVVDEARKQIYITETSPVFNHPALIVYDIEKKSARRVLERHTSVSANKNITSYTGDTKWTRMGGLYTLRIAVNGIAFDAPRDWVYFAAVNRGELYRIKAKFLADSALSRGDLASHVELFAKTTATDAMSVDFEGDVYLTDQEHGAIVRVTSTGSLETLLKAREFAFPDALSFSPDGWLYISCFNFLKVENSSAKSIRAAGPYRLYRFRPGFLGAPGQ